jgi:predicted MFS family arabinose efflux permease
MIRRNEHLDEANALGGRSIALLALAGFASAASMRVCDPLLPKLAETFQATPGDAAHAISAFAIAYGLLQLVYGPLGDRYGKRRVIALATAACTLGSVGAAIAPSLGWLVAFRVLSGGTAAAIIPLSMAWIGDAVPYARRQSTLARLLTGTILGMIGGQIIGGIFADTLGWRLAFVFLAGIYATVALMFHLGRAHMPPDRRAGRAGATVSAQARTILEDPWARTIVLVSFLEGAAVFGAMAFIPTYLNARFGLTLTAAGAILGFYGIGGLAYTFVVTRLVRAVGERGLAAGGGLLLSGALGTFILAPAWPWTFAASFGAGLGFYMLHGTLQAHATQMAPSARGTAVSLFVCALFLGQSGGVAAASGIVEIAGTEWVLGMAALACAAIGIVFSHILGRRHSRRQGQTMPPVQELREL